MLRQGEVRLTSAEVLRSEFGAKSKEHRKRGDLCNVASTP